MPACILDYMLTEILNDVRMRRVGETQKERQKYCEETTSVLGETPAAKKSDAQGGIVEIGKVRMKKDGMVKEEGADDKFPTTTKIIVAYIFANCTAVEIYSMVVMYRFQKLDALYSLITAVITESISFAVYCCKAYNSAQDNHKTDSLAFKGLSVFLLEFIIIILRGNLGILCSRHSCFQHTYR